VALMKAVTADEMRQIDRHTIETVGVPGEVLMAQAGRAVFGEIHARYGSPRRVHVVCGCGNNGGDGFVIAYLLANAGAGVEAYLVGDEARMSDTSKIFYRACVNSSISIKAVSDARSAAGIGECDLVVDSLFGTGFTGAPRGVAAEVIASINAGGAIVVAVDLPSGLPSDGEAPAGGVVKADVTVTMGLPKISLVTFPGKRFAGEVVVADIGFPQSLTESGDLKADLVDAAYAARSVRVKRDVESYKNSVGQLLIVGGFDGMEGAAMMTAMAAFECGIGLGTLLTTPGARNAIAGRIPELITASIPGFPPDEGDPRLRDIGEWIRGFFSERSFDAVVIGPGMGRSPFAAELFDSVIGGIGSFTPSRVVIDGDGLFHLANYLASGKIIPGQDVILTPHFGEASRLLGVPSDEIKQNRPAGARELARRTGAVALLKGPASIASNGDRIAINTSGNPALATAGSGDVLAGVIASLLVKGVASLDAAASGAFLHGLAADLFARESGLESMKATDLIDFLRDAISEIMEGCGR
jgi:NAD(P)H-hydrate epimerase